MTQWDLVWNQQEVSNRWFGKGLETGVLALKGASSSSTPPCQAEKGTSEIQLCDLSSTKTSRIARVRVMNFPHGRASEREETFHQAGKKSDWISKKWIKRWQRDTLDLVFTFKRGER